MLVFGLDGTFIETTSYADLLREARVPGGAGMPGEVSADGRVLIRALAPSPDLFREDGLVERSIRPIVAAAATSSFVAFEPVAAGRSLRADGRGISDPYAPYSPVTLGPPELPLIVGDETAWEIRYYDTQGDLARIARAAIPRQPFTAEVHERQRALLAERESGEGMDRARRSQLFDQLPTPDSLPALDEIHWSRAGHIWVRRRRVADDDGNHLYDVLDTEGRWLGTVPVPAAIGTIREIGSDYILAVRSDDLGVQSVTVLGLRSGG